MDPNKILDLFKSTLDPDKQKAAQEQLEQVHKIINFGPTILQIVVSTEIEGSIRLAAAIYLKNFVNRFWLAVEQKNPGLPIPFSIHEQDKTVIRDNIVEAIIHAGEPVRIQLGLIISEIIKNDFKGGWTGFIDKITQYLSSDDRSLWLGSLHALYKFVKEFEYKKGEDRKPLNESMRHLLGLVIRIGHLLIADTSSNGSHVLKMCFKIYFALVQFHLPLDLITREVFAQWMELGVQVFLQQSEEPECVRAVEDREEKALQTWWKLRKWVMHLFSRTFERYGSPGNVMKDYKVFSSYYLKTFPVHILQSVVLRILDQHRQQIYVSPRVLQMALSFLNTSVSHSITWKVIKPNMEGITEQIIFPLMCFDDEAEEMWEADPVEYVKTKFDLFEDFYSPNAEAESLLHSACSKRKEVLNKSMTFAVTILSQPDSHGRKRDGALRMIGAVSDILLKNSVYKPKVEEMLQTFLMREFDAAEGFLKARALWCIQKFSEADFKNDAVLSTLTEFSVKSLGPSVELPVRVEAAITVKDLIAQQEKVTQLLQPHVGEIIQNLLVILREAELDDVSTALQKVICHYEESVIPVAVNIMTQLAETFLALLKSESLTESEDRAMSAMSLLNTMETVVNVMDEHKEILRQLETIVLTVIVEIFKEPETGSEFYEETLSLIHSLTCTEVSPQMWTLFPAIYQLFQSEEGPDYFTDIMPALHNYVTVDRETFLSDPNYIELVYNMCKTVLKDDFGEDAECHAAKLLEVILINYRGQIDKVVPHFVQLALERLTKEVKTSELRQLLIQVGIAALYYNPTMFLEILQTVTLPDTPQAIVDHFITQWLSDTDCFLGLHDRKVCVLGLCCLLDLSPERRPQVLAGLTKELLPSLLLLFNGLKQAYATKAERELDSSDDDEEGVVAVGPGGNISVSLSKRNGAPPGRNMDETLDSDEDEVDVDGEKYMEKLEKMADAGGVEAAGGAGDLEEYLDDSDDSDDEYEETLLESYDTVLDETEIKCTEYDEYVTFRQVMEKLRQQEPAFFQALTEKLSEEQQKELTDVYKLAEQRRAAIESRKLESSGGYQFTDTSIPTDFNFMSPGGGGGGGAGAGQSPF